MIGQPRATQRRVSRVRDDEVRSYKHLNEIVKKDFRGVMRIKGYDKMMAGAKKHFDLIERLSGRTHLEYGEVAKLAKTIDQDFISTQDWAVKTKSPRMYTALESAISKPEALAQIEKLIRENNGIRNMENIDRRLGHYYAEKEYRESPNYNKDREMAVKYFKFMDLLKDGGSLTEIGRQIDSGWSVVGRWYKGQPPWMVKLASSILEVSPKESNVWLPTVTGPKNNPGGFIEVPREVTSHHQILDVLKQVKSMDGPKIQELKKRFGPSSKIDSFMYALGSLLADGSTQLRTDSNLAGSRMIQALGRCYDWSLTYGDGTKYHLSRIGIEMNRIADREYRPKSAGYPSSGSYNFQSQSSPFITWMRRSSLGLKDSESKTYDSVNADWILSAPKDWRTSFFQGVCDGDGCASLKSQYLSIGTSSNTEFFQELLKSFEITSHKGDGAVMISAKNSVKKAEETGMFRYATSRKRNLEKLNKMIDTFDHSRNLTSEEIGLVKRMREQGKSWGAISESLYDEFGYTLPYYSISRRAKKLDIE